MGLGCSVQGCLDPAEGQELEGPSTVRKIGKGSAVPLPAPGGTRGVAGEAPDTGSECESEGSWKGTHGWH